MNCTLCPMGFYSSGGTPTNPQLNCTTCPGRTTTLAMGATNATACSGLCVQCVRVPVALHYKACRAIFLCSACCLRADPAWPCSHQYAATLFWGLLFGRTAAIYPAVFVFECSGRVSCGAWRHQLHIVRAWQLFPWRYFDRAPASMSWLSCGHYNAGHRRLEHQRMHR